MIQRKRQPNGTYSAEDSYFNFDKFAADINWCRLRFYGSQAKLCKAINVCRTNYSKWENRQAVPTTEFFLLLCVTFDLNPMKYFKEPSK